MKKDIYITNLAYKLENGNHRISALINGEDLWFESSDTELFPSPEGFAGIFLITSLNRRANLIIDAALDQTWISNAEKLMKIFSKWWGYSKISILPCWRHGHNPQRGKETALCFTGGVDSFYSLLRSGYPIDCLVFTHGYDIALKDEAHMNLFKGSFEAIARRALVKKSILKTNLREHRIFTEVPWARTHGGALAAMGHFMRDFDRLLISSSVPYSFDPPWGSHHRTDHLFSSKDLKIVHIGASLWRSEKLRAITDESIVRDHLRVCWQNRKSQLNCCECEKCIRNMIILEQCGQLKNFKTFYKSENLVNLCNKLQYFTDPDLMKVYKCFLKLDLEPQLATAIRGLIKRSRRQFFKEMICSLPPIKGILKFIWLPLPLQFRKKLKLLLNF